MLCPLRPLWTRLAAAQCVFLHDFFLSLSTPLLCYRVTQEGGGGGGGGGPGLRGPGDFVASGPYTLVPGMPGFWGALGVWRP